MSFCGFNASALADVEGVLSLLSAAEMLQQKLPKISATFIHYSAALVTNFIAQNSAQALEPAAAPLRALAQSCRPAPAAEVERFGDSLVAGAEGDSALDFNRLAYLAYCSTSMYGPLTPRLSAKIDRLTQAFSSGNFGLGASFFGGAFGASSPAQQSAGFAPSFSAQPQGYPSVQDLRASATRGSSQGPPVYSPQQSLGQAARQSAAQGGPPTFTPQDAFNQSIGPNGPPVFTPGAFTSQGGPPTSFTQSFGDVAFGSAAGPPVYTPQQSLSQSVGSGAFTSQGRLPGQFTAPQDLRQSALAVGSGKARQLAELAFAAFSAGSNEIALTALMGAVTEAQK